MGKPEARGAETVVEHLFHHAMTIYVQRTVADMSGKVSVVATALRTQPGHHGLAGGCGKCAAEVRRCVAYSHVTTKTRMTRQGVILLMASVAIAVALLTAFWSYSYRQYHNHDVGKKQPTRVARKSVSART
jgi:hypothetical protein